MRLLERQSDGGFRLTENLLDKDISRYPYAILSHRWGSANEEVTFEDIENGSGRDKAGYKKIEFCGEQAGKDGLKYFWVDSCCIKKSSDPELSEAINSMYRWYSRAARCYVYLSDVSTTERRRGDENAQNTWEMTFRASEWFSRGWTLQELLAPGFVEFFSQERKRLGDKRSLDQQIHEITGIALPALQGTSISQFGVEERFKWAQNRQTTRDEDWAYCLLGIFDVSMPLIYGEGRQKAIIRLRKAIKEASNGDSQDANLVLEDLLKRLPVAAEAPFNSYAKQHFPLCLPNTRVDLLREIYSWADGDDKRCIFWLNGLAGTGKSTIARTVARRYFDQRRLGASFFFARGGGDVGKAAKFVTSIARQLADSVPALRQHISDAVSEHRGITALSLRDQWQVLVLSTLSKLQSNNHHTSYVLVIDALDECDGDRDIGMILQLLADAQALMAAHLRIFLTSRPEVPIRYGLSRIPDSEHKDVILHDISRSIVDHDISVFLEQSLKVIADERSLYTGWPGEEVINMIVQIAGGLFIWASTACKFIHEGQHHATKRLDMILKGSGGAATAPEKHLDEIYITVLKNSIPSEYTDEEKQESYRMLKRILGSIAVLSSPLSVSSLSRLLSNTKESINQTLEDLHSVLDIPKDETFPLRLHHPSFRDFLFNRDRCKDFNFWIDEKEVHQTLADRCIRLMSTSLRQDICGVDYPGVLATSVESILVEHCLPLEVQYSCLYWVQHLQKTGTQLQDNGQVHLFLKEHLLHWLEALGWMRRVPDGVLSAIQLESIALSRGDINRQASSQEARKTTLIPTKREGKELPKKKGALRRMIRKPFSSIGIFRGLDERNKYQTYDCLCLYALIHDIKRFALYGWPAIEQAPLQVYCSALIFAPAKSLVRGQFGGRIPRWIQRTPRVPEEWNAALATLEGHGYSVNSVAFSPDGKRLASGSGDRTVKLWDAESGKLRATLEGHGYSVNSVAFSPDGKRLASGSDDGTVKLWDAESGVELQNLAVGAAITQLTFSADGSYLNTDRDIIGINPNMPVRQEQPDLFVSSEWVMLGSQKLLWLPSEYRATCVAIKGQRMVLGHSSGRVSYFRFGFDKMNRI